ncbi:MAG: hypothetical protein E6J75_14600, partial [Deltaproteobacteria bacterium]
MARSDFRLLFERLELATELPHQILEAQEILFHPCQLPLGPLAASPVLGDARRFLDELPALFRPGREDLVELALPDDRVQRAPDAGVGEQLLDVEQPAWTAAKPVLALPRPIDETADLDLRGRHGDETRGVVDDHA